MTRLECPLLQANPDFKKSYRKRFPFKLATTSFIYRDSYAPNVARLAPYFDEIELLFFDGADPINLPDPFEIKTLAEHARSHDITYNVHLPTDVSLTDPISENRELAMEAIRRVVEAVNPLSPASYTLHLAPPPPSLPSDQRNRLRSETATAIRMLLERTRLLPSQVCVENLEDPFTFAEPVIEALRLGVCLDIGHLIHFKHDIETVVSKWLPRASVIHLHGVSQGRDHQALSVMDAVFLNSLVGWLRQCPGKTVCLEVFSLDALLPSLDVFEAAWEMTW